VVNKRESGTAYDLVTSGFANPSTRSKTPG
jgi:hypothetical protein